MQKTGKDMDNGRKWFIMTSPDPKFVELKLLEENITREKWGMPAFQYFIPYRFLKHRVADGNPEDDEFFNPVNRRDVEANNQLRNALKRYIFIRSDDRELETLLGGRESHDCYRTLWFYRDRNRNKLTVSDEAMERFIDACCDRRINFEVWPCTENIEENAEVVLNATPFKGYKARVLEVRQDRKGFSLTVGIRVLQGAMYLRLPSLRLEDVLYEPKTASPVVRENNRYRFIEDVQRQLLGILSRRTEGRRTEKSDKKDAAMLDSLYNYRYHTFASDAMRRKFRALMLLCAVLRGDPSGVSELSEKAKEELAGIEERPKSKMSVSVRAFLLAALYIATREETYRQEAMEYFRAQGKMSEAQKVLVGVMEECRTRATNMLQ